MELTGLFESSHMQYDIDRNDPHYEKAGEPHIKDMTEKAIQILSKNPKGYFLLVEGGQDLFFLKEIQSFDYSFICKLQVNIVHSL